MEKSFLLLAVAALAVAIAGCTRTPDDTGAAEDVGSLPSAATLGEQLVLTVDEYLAADAYAGANPANGEKQARMCKACHSLDKGGPNMIGPALFGFFGTKVGTRRGFEYSPVMRNADFIWTPDALNAWLAQPGRFLPGNRMTFAGVSRQQDRDDLIAYLLKVTSAAE